MDGLQLRARRTALALCLAATAAPAAALGLAEAQQLARDQAPALIAQRAALDGALAAQPAAGTLPDPRLNVGIDNVPVSGVDAWSLTRDSMTMQRVGLMQEVPNRAKRDAREAVAAARVERERALLAAVQLAVQREAALAWLAAWSAEARVVRLAELERENELLLATIGARVASGKAMPAEQSMARQEALALADRRDDARRDIAKARAALKRWVGARADEALSGEPAPLAIDAAQLRAGLHRHAEIAPYAAQRAMADAEGSEADAEQRGDWAWEVVYSKRGSQWGDMMSFQLSFDLPWQRGQRQQPQAAAKRREADRIEAERDETLRRHREELDAWLAELQAVDAQRERLRGAGLQLAAERVALALAAYESGRGDIAGVLAARRDTVEARLRLVDLDAQRLALQVRLTNLIAE